MEEHATPERPRREGKRYADLMAWQACQDLVLAVYQATATWPADERYGLTAQVRRASVSALVAIAEGSAKQSLKEFIRFLDIALGSLAEVECLLELAARLGYLTSTSLAETEILRDHAGRLTWGLYHNLKGRLKPRA